MEEIMIQAFWNVATACVTLIVPIVAIWFVLKIVADLLMGKR